MNPLPRLPLTVFEHPYARGHENLARYQVDYIDLATDRQRCSLAVVREHHALHVARVELRDSALSDELEHLCIYAVGS